MSHDHFSLQTRNTNICQMYMYMYIFIYTHIYTYIYIYTHIYAYACMGADEFFKNRNYHKNFYFNLSIAFSSKIHNMKPSGYRRKSSHQN